MGKHDRERKAKDRRNEIYAKRFFQKECENCGHKSSAAPRRCVICGHDRW